MSLDPFTDVYFPLCAGNGNGVDVAHDKALLRAERSQHRRGGRGGGGGDDGGKAKKTVFVWGLSHKIKEEVIKAFFQKYGDVRSACLIRDVVTRISKGFAFVEFERSKQAKRAREEANGVTLAGRVIRCQAKVGGVLKGWRPRRLGGGFGGRKESGQIRFGGKNNPFSSLPSKNRRDADDAGGKNKKDARGKEEDDNKNKDDIGSKIKDDAGSESKDDASGKKKNKIASGGNADATRDSMELVKTKRDERKESGRKKTKDAKGTKGVERTKKRDEKQKHGQ